MFDDRTSRRVGAVVIAALVLAAAAVLTVDCSRLRPGIHVTVYFAHIGPLEEGADIQIAGRIIGSVEAVQLLPASAVLDPAHPLHPAGGVAARLRILERYSDWAAPNGEFIIAVKGVLGDAYVEIGPPPAGAMRARGLEDGDQMRGVDPPRMDQVLVKSFQNMTEFRRLLDDLAPAAAELKSALTGLQATLRSAEPRPGAYTSLAASLRQVGREWEQLSDGISSGMAREGLSGQDAIRIVTDAGKLPGRVRAELGATREALDRLLADVARIRAHIPADLADRATRAVTRARESLARLQAAVASAEELVLRVRSGRGTVGALLNDPEFIDDAKKLGKILKREPWRILGHPLPETLEKN